VSTFAVVLFYVAAGIALYHAFALVKQFRYFLKDREYQALIGLPPEQWTAYPRFRRRNVVWFALAAYVLYRVVASL